ncbi:MAG: hypothetical protein IJ418_14590 [Clostridia bacterium]|nr:hypothetical protein [Clostridia bacterium]
MKKKLPKGLLIVLSLGLIVGGFFILTHVNFCDTYGGLMDDGKFVYITIWDDGTIDTNWLERHTTASYEITQSFSQRINKLIPGEYFADITFSDFSSGYYGYATGAFRTNSNGKIELVLKDGKLIKGIHTIEEYYFLQGQLCEETNPAKALEYYQRANGVSDAAERIKRLSEQILADYQDTDSYKYRNGDAFSDLLLIYDSVPAEYIDPLMNIAYQYWLQENTAPNYWGEKGRTYITTATLGRYEQDGIANNGAEPIVWNHIDFLSDEETIMLVAASSLEYLPYNESGIPVVWEESTLYTWLVDEFYNNAFTDAEKNIIAEVTLLSKDEIREINTNYQRCVNAPDYGADGKNYILEGLAPTISDHVIATRGTPRSKYVYEWSQYWLRDYTGGMGIVHQNHYGTSYFESSHLSASHEVVPVIILKPTWMDVSSD